MIAAEDAKFIEHEGFDWDGIQQALDRTCPAGHIVAGGSTISQQLAKNLFLSSNARSYWRKTEEAMITLMLEAMLDKRRNRALSQRNRMRRWHLRQRGGGTALLWGRRRGLNAEQAARLAAMAPNPRTTNASRVRGLARKIPIILSRMPAATPPATGSRSPRPWARWAGSG